MSTQVPDAPTFLEPVEVSPEKKNDGSLLGKFNKVWLGWLLALNRAVQDLQFSLPVAAQTFSLVSGPGPITTTATVTMRRPGTLNIVCSIVQTWATAAPSWSVDILVDGAPVMGTGTIANTWENVVSLTYQASLSAGTHTFAVRWTAGNANATLSALNITGFPVYTT